MYPEGEFSFLEMNRGGDAVSLIKQQPLETYGKTVNLKYVYYTKSITLMFDFFIKP